MSDDRIILNRVAEGLAWGGFGTACLLMLLTAIVAVDWPSVLRPALTDRVILFWLSVLVFGIGVLEALSAAFDDPNWCTVANPLEQRSLARAGLLYTHGQPESAERAMPTRVPPPTVGGSWPQRLWLGLLENVFGGRLGPVPASPRHAEAFPDTPLHEYWLAGLLALTEERLGIAALVQTLVVVGLVWLVYGLASRLFGRVAGLWAALAVALDPHLSIAATTFTADLPAALLTTLTVGLTLAAADTVRRRAVFTVGLLAALTVAMRPDLLLLPVLLLGWLLGRSDNPAVVRLRGWAVVGMVMLPIAVVWSLVALRNQELTGQAIWWPTDWPRRAMDGNALRLPVNADGRPTCVACWGTVLVGVLEDPVAVAGQMGSKLFRVWGLGPPHPTPEVGLSGLRYRVMPLLYFAVAGFAVCGVLRPSVTRCRATGQATNDAGPAWLLAMAIAAVQVPMVLLDFRDAARVTAIPLLHVFTGVLLSRLLGHVEPTEPVPSPAEPASPDSAKPEPVIAKPGAPSHAGA